jgi:hypothetical protein
MIRDRTRQTEAVREDLRERGFGTEDRPDGGFVAEGGGRDPLPGRPESLAVATPHSGTPLEVVSALARAADEGHVPVLVAGEETADRIREILADPPLLAGRDGGRLFYGVADRIRLQEGGYACVAAGPTETVRWCERADPSTDAPELVLTVAGEPRVELDSVGALTCPGPRAADVTLRYVREGGQFRVLDGRRPVAQYDSTVAMRADGHRPVELPLVPEHHVRTNGRLARAAVLATSPADGASVRYERPMRT